MKIKKTLASIAMAAITTAMIATSAQAVVCFTTTITRIGTVQDQITTTNSGHRVAVQGGTCSFAAGSYFFIHSDIGDPGLATALTAISLGNAVTIKVPDNPTNGQLIEAIHMDM